MPGSWWNVKIVRYERGCIHLSRVLDEEGWRVDDMRAASMLPLTAHDLAMRYGITEEAMVSIRAGLERKFGVIAGVLELRPERVCAYLQVSGG